MRATTRLSQHEGRAQLVITNKELDFFLIKLNLLPGMDVKGYGFLKMRPTGPVHGEEIYLPQHPNGQGKRIASRVDGQPAKVLGVNKNVVCGNNRVTYTVDTTVGSSGSPVIARKDNAVVALHFCAAKDTCENAAVDVRDMIAFLQSRNKLPRNALAVPAPPTAAAIPEGEDVPQPQAESNPDAQSEAAVVPLERIALDGGCVSFKPLQFE